MTRNLRLFAGCLVAFSALGFGLQAVAAPAPAAPKPSLSGTWMPDRTEPTGRGGLLLPPVAATEAPSSPAKPVPGTSTPAPAPAAAKTPPAAASVHAASPPEPVAPVPPAIPDANDEGGATGQLPEEVIGRQIDGPDGTVCTVVDADLTTVCATS